MAASPKFDGKKAYEFTRELAARIGSRFGGSKGEQKAARYIASVFRQAGLKTRLQPFPQESSVPVKWGLKVDGLGDIPCQMMLAAKNTPARGISAELVFLESGDQVYLGPHLEGKIVMMYGGLGRDAFPVMMGYKPAGIIFIEDVLHVQPRLFSVGPEGRRRWGSVPMLRVRYEDGARIVRSGAKRATMVAISRVIKSKSYNAIGELPGTDKKDNIVVVCGHYDSVHDGPGACDNASGTGVMMELARLYARRGSRRTLRFIAFGSEEVGLRGSIHYTRELRKADKRQKKNSNFIKDGKKSELDSHVFCLNVDVQGAFLGTNSAWAGGPVDIASSVRLLSCTSGPAYSVREEVYSSDNAPFSDAGVPSLSFGRAGATTMYGHTAEDSIDFIDPKALQTQGDFITEWMRLYITEPNTFPFERKIPDEFRKKLDNYFRDRALLSMDEGVEEAGKERPPRKRRKAARKRR